MSLILLADPSGATVGLRFRYGWALLVLLFLFCLRVLGQILVMYLHVRFLPQAEEWFSGLMPYPKLLFSQFLIILVYGKICLDVFRGEGYFASSTGGGIGLLIFASLYLGLMILRYIIRMTLYPKERWVGGCIPIFFHWVLSSFLLLVAVYYSQLAPHPVQTTETLRAIHIAAAVGGILCVLLWAIYQLAPSLMAARIGLGRSTFAVRPEKQVKIGLSGGDSIFVDIYRPRSIAQTPTLRIQLSESKSFRDAVVAGLISKMWAERGYTVILEKFGGSRRSGDVAVETGQWIADQAWFDGHIVAWRADSVRELVDQLRTKELSEDLWPEPTEGHDA